MEMASQLLQNTIFSILKAEQSEGILEEAAERTVGPESENVAGKLKKKKKLCNEALYNLCFSSDFIREQIKEAKWAGNVACI